MSSTAATIWDGVSVAGGGEEAGELTTGGGGVFEHALKAPTSTSTSTAFHGQALPPSARTPQPLLLARHLSTPGTPTVP